jgi:hypothetical protein
MTELKINSEDSNFDYREVSGSFNFVTEHKTLRSHTYLMINKGYLTILHNYEKLILSLRAVQAKEYSIDKEQTVHDNMLVRMG